MKEQTVRRALQPEIAKQIDEFCARIEEYRALKKPFTVQLDDPAGNSYIEPLFDYYHPTIDPQLSKMEKERTDIDRQMLGLAIEYDTHRTAAAEAHIEEGELPEVYQIETICSACQKPGTVKMHSCDIPHFKETLIVAFRCDYCGYKSNEVTSGGAIAEKGMKITLEVKSVSDLTRDVLKSNTATVYVPKLQLELTPGTLGGFFSTVQGLLMNVKEQLASLPEVQFQSGDSASVNTYLGPTGGNFKSFGEALDALCEVREPWTLILDDPLANIYIQNPNDHLPPPGNEDPQVTKEEYVRSFEQDEDLGIHDMDTEDHSMD